MLAIDYSADLCLVSA